MKWAIVTALLVFACKKADTTENKKTEAPVAGSAAGSASADVGSGSESAAPVVAWDPWNGPPPGSDTKSNAGIGDDLKAAAGEKLEDKALETKKLEDRAADIQAIAAPVDDGTPMIKGFANVQANNGYNVVYNPSNQPAHEHYRSVFQKNRVFENVAEGLNKTVRLPRQVDIQTVSCNTVNAFYDPRSKRIIVCYELFDYFLETFKGSAKSDEALGNAVMGAAMFTFFHEAGHSLIDVLDLPAVGREEDSVDQLATLTLIGTGDEGVAMALSGAYWFQLQSQSDRKTPFWDEHAFDGQRFYNIVCLIYGSNPTKYADFVTSGTLPKDRAMRCPEEYKKINKAWEKLLQPHFTNGAAENVDYTPSVPTKEAPTATQGDPWGDPSPTAPPTPAPAPSAAVTCEQIAERVGELAGIEAQKRAQGMTAAQIEQMKRELETQLPSVLEQVIVECAKENWSAEIRSCVMSAKSIDAAGKCGA